MSFDCEGRKSITHRPRRGRGKPVRYQLQVEVVHPPGPETLPLEVVPPETLPVPVRAVSEQRLAFVTPGTAQRPVSVQSPVSSQRLGFVTPRGMQRPVVRTVPPAPASQGHKALLVSARTQDREAFVASLKQKKAEALEKAFNDRVNRVRPPVQLQDAIHTQGGPLVPLGMADFLLRVSGNNVQDAIDSVPFYCKDTSILLDDTQFVSLVPPEKKECGAPSQEEIEKVPLVAPAQTPFPPPREFVIREEDGLSQTAFMSDDDYESVTHAFALMDSDDY